MEECDKIMKTIRKMGGLTNPRDLELKDFESNQTTMNSIIPDNLKKELGGLSLGGHDISFLGKNNLQALLVIWKGKAEHANELFNEFLSERKSAYKSYKENCNEIRNFGKPKKIPKNYREIFPSSKEKLKESKKESYKKYCKLCKDVSEWKKKISDAESAILILYAARVKSGEKPIFPSLRSIEHFTVSYLSSDKKDNQVVFFTGDKFHPANITSQHFPPGLHSWASVETMITVKFPKKECGCEGGQYECEYDNFRVIRLDELNYFKKNPDYAKIWIEGSAKDKKVIANFLRALKSS